MQLPAEAFAGFPKLLGIEFSEPGADRTVLSCEITPELLQPYGILHGGVYCSLIETAASVAAALWLEGRGHVVGVANHTNFLRAARSGRLTAVATPIHRGRTQQLWQVMVSDEAGRDLARGEVRLANISSANVLGRDSGTVET
ncbi:MAG TPA: PaaI family thioesterase [Streptosporangiaceae bacterium]|nr:PaaI family thioesterase [Streptosporangiaceae bacterium]